MPPSTARSTPVMKELSSEARNVTAAAISSGLPLRPIGICEANWAAACSACSGVRPVVVSKAGVSIGPGLIVFTRILRSFSSRVQARDVAHDRRNVSLDEGCGLLQLFLSSPSDHDVRTFFHEALGCGQANPAASARDDCNLTF